MRLIRSKGVGVYFVTQNPLDVPDKVLAQLGNRVQHALRAFTPRDQKAVKAAAETFRPNPKLDTAQVITELGKGEALVSFLEGNGTPSMVERTMIRPPSARIGPVTPDERKAVIAKSPRQRQIRHDGRSGIRLRDSAETRWAGGGRCADRARPAHLLLPARRAAPRPAPAKAEFSAGSAGTSAIFLASAVRAANGSHGAAADCAQCCAHRGGDRRDVGCGELTKATGQQERGNIGKAVLRGTLGGVMRTR